MKKIILNKSYGGFDVSKAAYKEYAKRLGLDLFTYDTDFVHDEDKTRVYYVKKDFDACAGIFTTYTTKDFGDRVLESQIDDEFVLYLDDKYREDELLIQIVEELGDKASGRFGDLKVVEIPDDVASDYMIDDYDGFETLHKRVQEW